MRWYFERGPSFLALHLDGASVRHQFGAVDTPGQTRTEPHDGPEQALAAVHRQVLRLERRGYTAGRRHPELFAAMAAAPEDPGPFLVYADWLLEHGDPRGQLTMLTAGGQSEDEVQAWLAAHPGLWAPWWSPFATATWRLGHIDRLTLTDGAHEAPSTLLRILRHPSGRFVREIVLDGLRWSRRWVEVLDQRPLPTTRVVVRRSPALAPLGRLPGVSIEEGAGAPTGPARIG